MFFLGLHVHHRTALYLISWLATVAAGLSATLFNVYLPAITTELLGGAAPFQTAMVGSYGGAAYLLGWAAGGIVLGAMGDRLGRKVSLFVSVLACSIGMAFTAVVPSVELLAVSRLITGAGAGGILLVTAVLVSEAWASGNRARMVGILINAFPMGFILVGLIHSAIHDHRLAFAFGGTSILLAVGVIFVVKESHMWERTTAREITPAEKSVLNGKYRRDLTIAILLFGSMLVGLWGAYTWMPTWVTTFTPDAAQARSMRAITVAMLGSGAVVGGLISGAASNTFGRRRAAAFGYVGALFLSWLVFLVTREAGPLLYGCTFLLSLCIGYNQGVLTAYIAELFPTIVRASAAGISFNCGRIVTSLALISTGALVQTFGGYGEAIATFALAYVVGLGTLYFARETRGQALPE
jgi:MFS family permease